MKHVILATSAAVAFSILGHGQTLVTEFSTNPGDLGDPVNEFTIFADGSATAVTGGLTLPTTGDLGLATGSFTWTWTPEDGGDDGLGGRNPWDETTFTGVVGSGWKYGGGTFGPDTLLDTGIQVWEGEAVRMVLDLSGLTLPTGKVLRLDSMTIQNQGAGDARFSINDVSESTITQIVGTETGLIAPVAGDPVAQPINQIVENGDEIGMWRQNLTGQVRIRGFQFSIVDAVPDSASLMTDFTTGGPGQNGDPTNVFNIYANGAQTSVTGGSSLNTTGDLGSATGSFTWTWSAEDGGDDGLGGRSPWDETTFTGVLGDGWAYNGGAFTFGPVTPLSPSIQVSEGEAVRMVLDLTPLSLPPGTALRLDSLSLQQEGSGDGRVSINDVSEGVITQIVGPGLVELVTGSDIVQPINLFVEDGDEIALWRQNDTGQLRIRGFQFSVVKIPPAPLNLAATFGSDSVDLSWDPVTSAPVPVSSYTVYRGTAPGIYDTMTVVAGSSFADTGLTTDVTYYYAVSSTDTDTNEGPLSGELAVTPMIVPLTTTFTQSPENNGSPTNVFTLFADGTATAVTDGNPDLPTTGNLDGATGSFTWTWTAEDGGDDGLGGRSPWDETTFTGVLGNGWQYNGGAFNFGPNTPLDTSIQLIEGEAVRMVLDLSGLTLPEGKALQLDSFNLQNEGAGDGRISIQDVSAGTITQLVGTEPGLIAPVPGTDIIQPVGQIVEDGDQIAVWRQNNTGQVRFRGFQFSVVDIPDETGYEAWAMGFGSLTDTDEGIDFDGGGLDTGIEYVVGGDPTDSSDDSSLSPTIDNSDPDKFLFIFRRADLANDDSSTNIEVEYSSNLGGWTTAANEGSGPGEIEIVEENDAIATGIDRVTVRIPRSLAVDNKLFARLNVTMVAPQ